MTAARAGRRGRGSRSSSRPTPAASRPACSCSRRSARITTEPSRQTVPADGGRGRDEVSPEASPRLTQLGRQLARLPIDPRLGRMLVEASRLGCLREVIVVAAALSMQDPRERPRDQQELADQQHRRFADPTSDFAGILNLWRYLKEQQKELSSSAFRRMCRAEFLNYLRIREWQDLDTQLRQVAKQLGLTLNTQPAAARGDPPGAAGRAAVAHRADGRRAARLPRCPRHPVRDLPRVGAVQEAARVRDGGRAGRDRRGSGAGSTPGSTRRGPRQVGAHLVKRTLQRAALGEEARRGHGATRRSRCTACRSSPTGRSTTAGSTRRRRARSSSGTRWCKGSGETHHRFFARQPGAARGGRGPRAPRPAARHRRRRRDDLRLLRRAGARPTSCRRRTSTRGGRRSGAPGPTC